MSEIKHTPGPWVLGAFNEMLGYDCMFAGVRVGHVVLEGSDYGQKACAEMNADDKSRMMADARLIAAAPELLDVARLCLEAEEARLAKLKPGAPASAYTAARIAKIKAAIAKATGAAQ